VEAAARDGKVAAVACLTLDRGVPGLDPGARAAAWGATPILLLATEEDMALGTRPFAEAAAGKPAVETKTPLGKGIHGTGMIGKGVGVEGDALGFLQVFLGRQVLDGVVDPLESVNGGSDDLPKAIFLSPKGSILRARLDSRFLNFSFQRPAGEECPPKITLVLTAPREEGGARVEGKATVWGTANGDGAMTGVMVGGDFFSRKPEGGMPDAALVKGNVLEARIPWTVFGTVPVDGSSVSFRCEAEASPTTVLLQGAFGKKR
jgi:hypothetical protein